ncbi:hypothetical protein LOTGIDRAFT_103819 [Lottia gigantea]|uniref:Zinc transporter 1 n=1 Tax=Lottia gigantea TaxID=225164 RepID=V4ARY0_LOTGI|nr:hypothetical protein LOTGIDRAFT_103819 [Lottia gigantea]ESO97615.1 hypothetical protein LOTGIDRAFT_103819 [Lottia gigantea]
MGKYSSKTCRLLTMLGLTASFFLVEIVVGYVTNSIALVADSFHMLSDVVALIIGFASVRMSKWPSKRNTFGWARAEVLGAMINSVFLIALCFSIMVEALKRLIQIEEVEDPKLLLIVGSVGLLVNIIGLFLFHDHGHSHGGGGHGHSHGGKKGHGHSHGKKGDNHQLNGDCSGYHEDQALVEQVKASNKINGAVTELNELNMRGVFLHVLGDALGSVIVVISSLVIWFGEGDWKYYVDPAMSIAMVMIILSTSIPLLKDSSRILLQTVPSHIEVEEISKKLMEIEGVMHVHELHIWQLAGSRIVASAHIRCHDPASYMKIGKEVKDFFHNEGIHSTTIQPEFEVRIGIMNIMHGHF